ncbi:MAG: peptidoglycan DD-metalloendopeptidase family protein [Roseburia sp.]|nr:peptidoglycan DD-metalloendopeptidase family protein [Roseburia sp.]
MATGRKRKKNKVRYSILFVPDVGTADVKRFSMKAGYVAAFFVAIALLVAGALGYCSILTGRVNSANRTMAALETQIDTLTSENTALLTENEELQGKVTILSDTVNDKVLQEEAREAELAREYTPTGFPLKGMASYEERASEGHPMVVFNASQGTSVLATAKGTVTSVEGDAESGYIIMVDHANGYVSVYRNASAPKVSEGDEVSRETELFEIETGKEELGYQIILNDAYVQPLELMEIYG